MFLQKNIYKTITQSGKFKKNQDIKKRQTDHSRTKFFSMYKMDYKYCVAVLNVRHNLKDTGHGEIFLGKS